MTRGQGQGAKCFNPVTICYRFVVDLQLGNGNPAQYRVYCVQPTARLLAKYKSRPRTSFSFIIPTLLQNPLKPMAIMPHNLDHEHGHRHDHPHKHGRFQISRKRRLQAVIAISFSFFVVEISIGFYTASLALLADAFHYVSLSATLSYLNRSPYTNSGS